MQTQPRFDEWKANATALLRRLDPGAAELPLYILMQSEAVSALLIDDCRGITGRTMSTDLRHLLIASGEWEGFGFATILCDDIETYLDFEWIVVHEYCHFVEHGDPGWLIEMVRRVEEQQPAEAAAWAPAEPIIHAYDPPRPWSDHDHSFIRMAAHLARRAEMIHRHVGWDIDDVVPQRLYLPQSRASAYAEHLGDEPERLAHLPMTAVATTSPPPAYEAFAAADLERAEFLFQKYHRRPTAEQPAVETNETDDVENVAACSA